MTCERFHYSSTNPDACRDYQQLFERFCPDSHPCAQCENRITRVQGPVSFQMRQGGRHKETMEKPKPKPIKNRGGRPVGYRPGAYKIRERINHA